MLRDLLPICLISIHVAGCGETTAQLFDPCSEMAVAVGTASTEVERAATAEAIEAWSAVLPARIDFVEEPGTAPLLAIYFESGDLFYRSLYIEERGQISIARDRLDETELPIAIAHEMGHAFGLEHVEAAERLSVMNVGNVAIPPNEGDAEAARASWPACDTSAARP